ncbi:MAG TPA: hypothetical protein VF121_04855 [Thermoanaerobaculia bacterium]|nr:hypothetical protein [Thermoanaerobaculia bacterium]
MSAPDDANDLRGVHARRLMSRPSVWIPVLLAPALVGPVVGDIASPAIGLLAALAALSIGLGVVLWFADSRAGDDFFELYAQQRSLALDGESEMRAATPLLLRGSKRYAVRTLEGELGDGVEGTLALYTYEETTSTDKGVQTSYFRYTLGLVEVPECAALVPELFCQRKSGLRALIGLEDALRKSRKRVRLESEGLDRRYEIFAGKDQDAAWLRRLFSPSFIVWLTDSAPKKFAFELWGGMLCCYVKGHKQSAKDLDAIRAASATVARRLRDEALE